MKALPSESNAKGGKPFRRAASYLAFCEAGFRPSGNPSLLVAAKDESVRGVLRGSQSNRRGSSSTSGVRRVVGSALCFLSNISVCTS